MALVAALMAAVMPVPRAGAKTPRVCGTVIVPTALGTGVPPGSVTSLNPLFAASGNDDEIIGMLYYGLIWVNRVHKIEWSRSMATGIKVSKNDTVFTVSMKKWVWSDGVPVTSADVKYMFDLVKKMGPTYREYGDGGIPTLVKHFTLLGPEKFSLTLAHPVNPDWFELTGLATLIPLPEHVWGRYTINQMWRRQSDPRFFRVVDGAYQIESYAMGRHMSFVPNPRYEGHRSQIKRFVVAFLHSSGAEIEGLRTGALDMSNLPFSLWPEGRRLSELRRIKMAPSFRTGFYLLNFRNKKVPFFRDVRVRRAFADAIDQAQISKLLTHGLQVVQYGPVPVDPPTFLSPSAQAGHYPVGYDPAKARALLRAAGWKRGKDGIRVKDGKRLSFVVKVPSGGATSMLGTEFVQQELRAIGMQMKIRVVTLNQAIAMLGNPDEWEATKLSIGDGNFPSGGPFFRTGAPINVEGYSDKKMDRLLANVDTAPGLRALYDYENYAEEQQPEIFSGVTGSIVLARKGIRGVNMFLSPMGSWSPQYLYFTRPDCQGATVKQLPPPTMAGQGAKK
jgi:peptide/nickel transport system substrate-binding protein